MLLKAEPQILRPTQAAYDGLARTQLAALADLAHQLAIGAITPEEWADRFHEILLRGHSQAWMLGRQLAGDLRPLSDGDLFMGRGRADLESTWMRSFLENIVDGRYTDDEGNLSEAAIRHRSQMYQGKQRATSSIAWTEAGPPEAEYHWILVAEDHCDDCPRIEKLSPFTLETLFTHPGDGDTTCRNNCACFLKRGDGVEMFQRYPRPAA